MTDLSKCERLTCSRKARYWVQALGNSSNVLTCGRHLSSVVDQLSARFDVTVKVVVEYPDSRGWGHGQANSARRLFAQSTDPKPRRKSLSG